jgi:hypothetical protein
MAKTRSRQPDCVLNPGTFGGSLACHHLVDLLNANAVPPFDKRKVLKLINNSTFHFKHLSIIEHWGVKRRAMTLVLYEVYDRIEAWPYPTKVKSLTRNVVHHHYRKYLKEAPWTIAP